ncbi:MAG: oxygen-dependent coproporphyrinogen oxidase [Deltaproteobacteria bacterium]|nr:oxygen-dependent coproporphyrinogen oxidase [Deltaproteobacteria bacterium]
MSADPNAMHEYLSELQARICAALEAEDGAARFRGADVSGAGGVLSRPRVLEGGAVVEKAAVNFTHARGPALPPAATEGRPQLAGQPFEAVSLSLIVHPRNPYAPTTHMNLRLFSAGATWWFGGGFDLTPYYGDDGDCAHWHRTARAACAPLGPGAYPRFKKWCDEYFFLPHRGEPRGIGGVFFDDLAEPDFATCLAFVRSVGDAFLPAYQPILARRKNTPHGERERQFQLYRRGRYVEFNLVYDRGTKYGMQSGRRVENVLASMPPLARWEYEYRAEPGSPEARLTEHFLVPREWASE